MAPQYSRKCCQKLRKRQKLAEKFVRTTSYIDSWATWKEFHHSSLGTSVQMCTYTIFSACRYIALTAIVKVRVGCTKTVWNEQVCAHQKSYRKYIFQNIFEAIMHRRDCSCAPVLRFFFCGFRWRHSKPPNSEPYFWSIFTSLRKDSVASYVSIWTV